MNMVLGLSVGVATAKVLGPTIQGLLGRQVPTLATPALKPVFTLVAGGVASFLVGNVLKKRAWGKNMLVGAGIAAVTDLLDQYVVPQVSSMLGLSDYVQMPYSDYVQMPYSGYGTPAQVAAGEFSDYVQMPYSGYGTPAQVAAGEFGAHGGEMATFGPTF